METHINARGYTSSVGVQWESNMDARRHCGNPLWKHTFTQEDNNTSYVGVQPGNTDSFRPTGTPVIT